MVAMAGPIVSRTPTTYIQTDRGYSNMKSMSYNSDYKHQPKLRNPRQPMGTTFMTQIPRQQIGKKSQQKVISPSENVALEQNVGGDGNGSSRLFSFTAADDQEQVDLTEVSYIVSYDDNCGCITFPFDVADEDIGVFQCTKDVFWDRIRLEYSDSSCFELEFPEGVMYNPYCTGETIDQCALCTIELSMALDEGSSSLTSSNSEEDSTANSLGADKTGGTTTDTEDGSLVGPSSSGQTTSDQPSSTNQLSPSSAAGETTTQPPTVSPATTSVGFSIGRLLTLAAMIVLAIQ